MAIEVPFFFSFQERAWGGLSKDYHNYAITLTPSNVRINFPRLFTAEVPQAQKRESLRNQEAAGVTGVYGDFSDR